eukprot:360329-Chlamydomonas_euryale.AAC.11
MRPSLLISPKSALLRAPAGKSAWPSVCGPELAQRCGAGRVLTPQRVSVGGVAEDSAQSAAGGHQSKCLGLMQRKQIGCLFC